MRKTYSGVEIISGIQGNTVRKAEPANIYGQYNNGHDTCVVYEFRNRTWNEGKSVRSEQSGEYRRRRRISARKKAARARARKVRILRTALAAFLLITVIFGIGGIASRAKSREVPEAYKYYDTITVAYQENLLDIVLRYDDRNYYETQTDYLEELCRINNLEYDGSAYPVVTPGTHLIVPYYSAELK